MGNRIDIIPSIKDVGEDAEAARAIGLNWGVAKNGRLRAMFRRIANPGSHKCPCGKVLSSNKAWEHVQACEIAQAEFKAAREKYMEAVAKAKAAQETAKNDEQGTAGEDPKPQDPNTGANAGVIDTPAPEGNESVPVPEAI